MPNVIHLTFIFSKQFIGDIGAAAYPKRHCAQDRNTPCMDHQYYASTHSSIQFIANLEHPEHLQSSLEQHPCNSLY